MTCAKTTKGSIFERRDSQLTAVHPTDRAAVLSLCRQHKLECSQRKNSLVSFRAVAGSHPIPLGIQTANNNALGTSVQTKRKITNIDITNAVSEYSQVESKAQTFIIKQQLSVNKKSQNKLNGRPNAVTLYHSLYLFFAWTET